MAKKKAATKKSTAGGKTASRRKAPGKVAHAHKHVHEELALAPLETQALELTESSEKVRVELEQAVTGAAAVAVRKVFRLHKIRLNPAEAANLTVILFGE
jgi:hypothetical protein